MKIDQYCTPYLSSNVYLITENGHGILIDACEMPTLSEKLHHDNIVLDYVILTHEHSDHITGVSWAQALGARVICSAACGANLLNPRMNYSHYFELIRTMMDAMGHDPNVGMQPFVCHGDILFSEHMDLGWQGNVFKLTCTPGHSLGSICCLLNDDALFCGDTLFEKEATITKFLGGSEQQLLDITMPYLRGLDQETIVYPGHFEPFILKMRSMQ